MTRITYSYSVLRYVHDVITGECLNVGVVLYAPSEGYVRAKLQHHYSRLSSAFQGFHGEYYRRMASHIENQINVLPGRFARELPFHDAPTDAKSVCNLVLPDDDSSLQFAESRGGISEDLDATLADLFDRYVMRHQTPTIQSTRTDEEVWRTFKTHLVNGEVMPVLRPVTIRGGSFEYDFDHAWKNQKWHPLEALSMDAEKPETLKERAVRWVGRATLLQADESLGKLYLLLGRPTLESFATSYSRAKDLLHEMPVDHALIEEDEAEDFVAELGRSIREHEQQSEDL